MELSGQTIAVIGAGKTGLAVVRFAKARGASVILNDERTDLDATATQAADLADMVCFGEHPVDLLANVDTVVVSPGVPDLPMLSAAQAAGAPVISEVELAARYIDAPIVAITGTNGKSTVTTMVGKMCEASGLDTFTGGNLGQPMLEAIDHSAAKGGRVVVELSSFQLERVSSFVAHVGVILNITDDHLDRYPSFSAYAAAKHNVLSNQRESDHRVLPSSDADLARAALPGRGRTHLFGADGEVCVKDGVLHDHSSELRVPVEELSLLGRHNQDNACAAALTARLAGAAPDVIAQVLRTYRGLPHRMQPVGKNKGVLYVDDSKATNVGAAVAAIDGVADQGQVVLIAGGVHKGGSYAPLVRQMAHAGRAVVAVGEATALIEDAFSQSGLTVERASSMPSAVQVATRLAEPGDVVLLAPACSSFDMFASYAERGDAFQQAVRQLGVDR